MSSIGSVITFVTKKYLIFYFVITFLVFIWKGVNLPYAPGLIWLEFALLLALSLTIFLSLILAQIEEKYISSALIVPTIGGVLYFIFWQNYVLRIELITNGIMIVFQLLFLLNCLIK